MRGLFLREDKPTMVRVVCFVVDWASFSRCFHVSKVAIEVPPMTQRYYFHLVASVDEIVDTVGVEIETEEQARRDALAVILEMQDAGDLPQDHADWRLEIRTWNDQLILVISL